MHRGGCGGYFTTQKCSPLPATAAFGLGRWDVDDRDARSPSYLRLHPSAFPAHQLDASPPSVLYLLTCPTSIDVNANMRELLSALGAFEVVDAPLQEGDALSWAPKWWERYPLSENVDLDGTQPWIRPRQVKLSFIGQ